MPTTPEGVQAYFMRYLQAGEALLQQGPAAYETSAICFFRALRVYPDPMALMTALEQSLPQPVMAGIMQLMSEDVANARKMGADIQEEIE